MTRGLRSLLMRFRTCTRGVAAIEFALVAPVLVLALGLSIEVGRAFQAYTMMNNAVSGIGRTIASYPEYDLTVRNAAPRVANALLPPDWQGRFSLQVTSLTKNNNVMQETFTHTLFGSRPAVTSAALPAANFEQGESVIQLVGSYRYVPLLNLFSGYTFTTTYAVSPYFSRGYAWNANVSPDKYVR